MPALYDLNLMTVSRFAGNEHPELMGLYTTEPLRHAARGRSEDRLVLYLALLGNAPLAPGKQEQLLAEMARVFYQTPGSVTSALRQVVENLNRILLERNLRLSSSGQQALGVLTQLVLRERNCFLAQSGGLHAYLITAAGVQHFHDPEMMGRGLGLGRVAPVYYSQAALQPNDTLVLAATPSPAWNASSLVGLHGQGPESLRRRLFTQPEPDLHAVLIQARSGKGKLFVHPWGPALMPAESRAPATVASPLSTSEPAVAADLAQLAVPPVTPPASDGLMPAEQAQAIEPVTGEAIAGQPAESPASVPSLTSNAVPGARVIGAGVSRSAQEAAGSKTAFRNFLKPVGHFLAAIGAPLLRGLLWLGRRLGALLVRLAPGEPFVAVPSYVMAFIALAVPVILVAIASVAYFRLGRSAQYELLYTQAQQQAVQALGQTEVQAQRDAWQAVLVTLDRADVYQKTPDTQVLRGQARRALDALDLVRRVAYQPAIVNGLPTAITIRRMVISGGDLYMLDGNSGNVLRADLTSRGFVLDPDFQCGPNRPVVAATAPIIDILAWPAGFTPAADLLALDASGNLMFCKAGASPELQQLAPPHIGAWGRLVAFTLDFTNLYLLDPPANAVWVYWGNAFIEQPNMFFDENIPYMQDLVDMAVNRDDLYLLHADGHISLCTFDASPKVPTRCQDPQFVDARPGRENTLQLAMAPFSRMLYVPPPDPSLFMLDPLTQAIYQFSLQKLVFQRQFLPQASLPAFEATAFWVDVNKREVFLAIGNAVYYGIMP